MYLTEMKRDILDHSETKSDCLVLKINEEFFLSKEEGSTEMKIFSLFWLSQSSASQKLEPVGLSVFSSYLTR